MTKPNRSSWWFLLGHEPLLSLAEIKAVTHKHDPAAFTTTTLPTPRIARLTSGADFTSCITSLGGTIKIARELLSYGSWDDCFRAMTEELETLEGKIEFGFSFYSPTTPEHINSAGLTLKKHLQDRNRSARFVFNGEIELSSVSVTKNNLITKGREFLIIERSKDAFAVAVTTAIQPFEAFSERDYGRPGRDDVSGMLPPKLAMMMINCTGSSPSHTLLDPSCGSGTILNEALLLGYRHVIGTDISEKAVSDSLQNHSWIQEHHPETASASVTIRQADARSLPQIFPPHSIDAIASEPFMGPPLTGTESRDQLVKNAQELIELYSESFQAFAQIVKPGGTIVYSIPRFITRAGTIVLSDQLISAIKKSGFKPEPLLPAHFTKNPYILYHRNNQHVGREIWKFVRT